MTVPSSDNTQDTELPEQRILGVDAQSEDYTPNEADTDTTDTEPSEEESGTQQSQEPELDSLQQKARFYDMIDSDPTLVGLINDYYTKRSVQSGQYPSSSGSETTTQQPKNNESEQGMGLSSDELKELRQQNEQLRNMVRNIHAHQQISDFSREHPDFDNYKQDVGKLIQQHPTFSLQEAYDLVKRTNAAQTANSARPPAESAENGSPVADSHRVPDLDEITKARSTDDAIKLAWLSAQGQR